MIQIDTRRLIGLTQEQADKLISAIGGIMLVVSIDGIPQNNRTDRRMDRVCVEVLHGRITKATCL